MRRGECLTVVLGSIPIGIPGCSRSKSGGSAVAVRVNLAETAKSADTRTIPATNRPVFDRGTEPAVPSNPPPVPASRLRRPPLRTQQAPRSLRCDVGIFLCPFDGVVQNGCASCTFPPPDPNAAAGAGVIVEVVNDLIQVTNEKGAVQCGGPVRLDPPPEDQRQPD